MRVAYARVSTNKQDVEKYVHFFQEYARRSGDPFDRIVTESISASKTELKNRKLWTLLNDPAIKEIVVTEVSRLGRNTSDGVELLKQVKTLRKDLRLYVIMSNLTIYAQMNSDDEFLFDLQMSLAKKEVRRLAERIKIGIDSAREKGVRLGRPERSRLDDKREWILQALEMGKSKSSIARDVKCSRKCLYNWLEKQQTHS